MTDEELEKLRQQSEALDRHLAAFKSDRTNSVRPPIPSEFEIHDKPRNNMASVSGGQMTGEFRFVNRLFKSVAAGSPYAAANVLSLMAAFLAPLVMIYVFLFMPLRWLWRLAKRGLQSL